MAGMYNVYVRMCVSVGVRKHIQRLACAIVCCGASVSNKSVTAVQRRAIEIDANVDRTYGVCVHCQFCLLGSIFLLSLLLLLVHHSTASVVCLRCRDRVLGEKKKGLAAY